MPELIASSVSQSTRSWIGSTIVVAGAVFFILALNEGNPRPYQREIDSILHNGLAMALASVAIWTARRGTLGRLRTPLRPVSFILLSFFTLFTVLDLLTWQPLWDALKPLGIIQSDVQAYTVIATIWLWGACLMGLGARGLFRWFRKRYEHHGIAIGFGPLYFYFRRRRVS